MRRADGGTAALALDTRISAALALDVIVGQILEALTVPGGSVAATDPSDYPTWFDLDQERIPQDEVPCDRCGRVIVGEPCLSPTDPPKPLCAACAEACASDEKPDNGSLESGTNQ